MVQHMKYMVEDFIESANSSSNREELFARYISTLRKLGFTTAVYTMVTDHHLAGEKSGHALQSNFPSDWLEYYFEKNYTHIDPVTAYVHDTNKAFAWNEIHEKLDLSNQQKTILHEARAASLFSGIGIPLHGARGELAGVGLAGDIDHRKFHAFELTQAQFITEHFHHMYCDFGNGTKNTDTLTEKEKEILKWMAVGKSVYDTSVILGISQDTVKFHRKNIFRKLDACNKTYAIVKALRLGIISLDKIALT